MTLQRFAIYLREGASLEGWPLAALGSTLLSVSRRSNGKRRAHTPLGGLPAKRHHREASCSFYLMDGFLKLFNCP